MAEEWDGLQGAVTLDVLVMVVVGRIVCLLVTVGLVTVCLMVEIIVVVMVFGGGDDRGSMEWMMCER